MLSGCQLIGRPTRSSTSGCNMYYKAIVNDVVFYSKHYKRVKKRNSYTVSYMENEHIAYGHVQHFLKTETGSSCAVIHALIPEEHTSPVLEKGRHLLRVREDVRSKLIPIYLLRNKCIFMCIDGMPFVALFPNFLYYD